MVQSNHLLRGCMFCDYSENIPLPPLRKKIIYLDQFFFSAAFRERDSRFLEAAELIKRATSSQVLIAPFSSIHEDETHQWRGFDGRNKDDLMQFIKATSRGHQFEPSYRVEHDQILKAFESFVQNQPSDFHPDRRLAIRSDINHWEDYFRIDIREYRGDIEQIRNLKNQSVESLIKSVFPAWRKSKESFYDHVEIERRDSAKIYLNTYYEYLTRIARGDHNALFDSPISSMVVQNLFQALPKNIGIGEKYKQIDDFFRSDHFANIPNEWLSSRIFAVLREQVRNGAYQNLEESKRRLSGFLNDVKHVSIYSPFVDVMLVDQPMAAILADGRINIPSRYGTKIYSLNTWPNFLSWLQSLIDSISDDHRQGLELAYP
ncbi:hypothetical protein [Arenimonas maotaiensis]|nr:hypothetical protein [Arenimonas maotaiensis]